MRAEYADNYSEATPVIKVVVRRSNGTDLFDSVRQDWMAMVQTMIKDYMEAGLYKQSLDGKGLLGIFTRFAQASS